MAEPTAYQKIGTTALDVTEAGKKELWYLAFDGVDDVMSLSLSVPLNDTMLIQATRHNVMNVTHAALNAGMPNRIFAGLVEGGNHRYRAGDSIPTEVQVAATTLDHVHSTKHALNVVTGYRDGVQVEGTSASAITAAAVMGLGLVSGGTFFNGRFYGGTVVNQSNDSVREQTEAFLASRSGVTL